MAFRNKLIKLMCGASLCAAPAFAYVHPAAIGDDVLLMGSEAKTKNGFSVNNNGAIILRQKAGSAEWDFELTEDGDFSVFYEVAAMGWMSTSKMEFSIDGVSVATNAIPNTNNSMEIKLVGKNQIPLKKGEHTLKITPIWAKNPSMMGMISSVRITKDQKISEMVDSSFYEKKATFGETLNFLRENNSQISDARLLTTVYPKLWGDFPHQMSWLTQDLVPVKDGQDNPQINHRVMTAPFFKKNRDASIEKGLLARVLTELSESDKKRFESEIAKLGNAPASNPRWFELYEEAAKLRRATRLKPLLAKTDEIIFAKHQVFGWKSGIYNITETEGLHPKETSELCTIDLNPEKNGQFAPVNLLFNAEGGIVRDPELSYDADRLLFAWRKTNVHRGTSGNSAVKGENYQVYEMNLADKSVRQLTTEDTYGGNYEAVYLPNDNIVFNSARIVQQITCGWGDHSNLYIMDKDGKYQRRLGFDQVSTQFPTVLNDGRVIYLRRDYNDRGQVSAHALFSMNPDGTQQDDYYGNQTDSPTSFMHARAIPNSSKVVCVLSGYHTRQGGQLAIIDTSKGVDRAEGVVQIPQGTKPPYRKLIGGEDGYLKDQIQYANPFALSETEFIVSRSDEWCTSPTGAGYGEHYGVYFMTADNRRELLAYDADTSCLQPIPVMKREKPSIRPSMADYTKDTGTFYVQNVNIGPAMVGATNQVKKIRVIELLYKHQTIRSGTAFGPGGGSDTVTPPAHPLALFDAKKVIGEATVYEDGSAMFEAPARTPLYFQLLDDKNRAIQTMRSWTTLMPSERFSCVGCHEDKNETPVTNSRTIAMSKGVEKLKPFYGEPRGFSYLKEVQPIFDAKCVSCHAPGKRGDKLVLTKEPFERVEKYGREFAQSYVQIMAARPGPNPEAFRVWNGPESWNRSGPAKADEPNRYVQYWGRLRQMEFQKPYFAGAIASGLTKTLEGKHYGVKLTQEEWDKIVCWIDLNCPYSGDYMEGNIWNEGEIKNYENRIKERVRNEAIEAEAIKAYIEAGQP